jgi:hypothetical protein
MGVSARYSEGPLYRRSLRLGLGLVIAVLISGPSELRPFGIADPNLHGRGEGPGGGELEELQLHGF